MFQLLVRVAVVMLLPLTCVKAQVVSGPPTAASIVGVVAPGNGGTGINNGTSTITLGGNFVTGGALNLSGSSTVVFGNTLNSTPALSSNQLILPNGACGVPTYTYSSDANTGWYLDAVGSLTACTSSTQRLRVRLGVQIGVPTGGDPGVGKLNLASDLQDNGTAPTGTAGTGYVRATSPVLVTPNLGTPSTLVATNATGTAAGLTAGNVTTNANLTGPITSSGNATAIASQTGTGTKFVVDTSPTFATSFSLNSGASKIAVAKQSGWPGSTYNCFALNNDCTFANIIGIVGGDVSDNTLYVMSGANAVIVYGGGASQAIFNGGVQFGAPTGAAKGVGTLNSQGAIYDNGTAPTGTAGSGYVRATSPSIASPTITGTAAGAGTLPNAMLVTTPVAKVSHQTFTATGTYTPATGILYAIGECVGGGGGGGGSAGSATGGSGGGGGGAGSYSKVRLTAAQIGASQAITIPTASAGAATGNNAGTAGGDVSLGTLLVCKGGAAGGGAAANSAGAGGAGGIAGTGDVTGTGQSGRSGLGAAITTITIPQAQGGSTLWGGATVAGTGVAGGAQDGSAAAAGAFGAGGNGGIVSGSASTAAGGAGAKGFLLVTEYLSQ